MPSTYFGVFKKSPHIQVMDNCFYPGPFEDLNGSHLGLFFEDCHCGRMLCRVADTEVHEVATTFVEQISPFPCRTT
ncbi:MAG: hypothetical protein CM1200mP29_02580 [Verrucomicrobiota bacterium]|nr:MAG: hypothetical protein CM1200mP29_02580 [Verrucomicrobiota bacterium]